MTPTLVPTVPTVTIRATYDCAYWPDVCGRCGAEATVKPAGYYAADGSPARYPAGETDTYYRGGDAYCPACGRIGAELVSPAEDPAQWGGWCDPANPWGTADDWYSPDDDGDAYGRGEPIELELTIWDAAEVLRDFPGAIADTSLESEAGENYRTGVDTRVMAHVSGPGALAALELAGVTE